MNPSGDRRAFGYSFGFRCCLAEPLSRGTSLRAWVKMGKLKKSGENSKAVDARNRKKEAKAQANANESILMRCSKIRSFERLIKLLSKTRMR